MTCDQCTDRLSDAIDGTLGPEELAQIEAHCRECAACRELRADLAAIREAAASLERHLPSAEVWTSIERKIGLRAAGSGLLAADFRRRLVPLAAAAAVVLMTGAAVWFDLASRLRAPDTSTVALTRTASSELQLAEQHYENAIRSLEQLASNKDALDPAVAAEIAASLASIDRAIADSRAALDTEPDSLVAQTSLLEALRMKVALLQETVSLMNARS